MRYLFCLVCFGIVFLVNSTCIAKQFPYRNSYPEVNVLDLSQLKAGYDSGEFIVVDVRSKTEFDTIHIRNAVNVPYADAKFLWKLEDVVVENLGRAIVVYGNGIDCIKSYKAAEDATENSLPEIYAYDGGIMAWANAYPADTILLNNVLQDPEKQLIGEDTFLQRNLEFEEFKQKIDQADTVVIDARDPIQRKHKLEGLENALLIPIDKFVKNIVGADRLKNKQLLVFDQVGGQVAWLMYHLVEKGYSNFYFLSGGATSVLKKQEYRLTYVR